MAPEPLEYESPFAVEVYRERSPGMRRKFTLHRDRLIIEGRVWWQSEFEMPVSLRAIDTLYGVIRRRSSIAGPGALILGSIFATLFAIGWWRGEPPWFPIGATIDAALALLSFTTGFRYLPKIEYYSFQRTGGGTAFDIARSGPDRDRFEQFVSRIIDHVTALQRQGPNDIPLPPVQPGPASVSGEPK